MTGKFRRGAARYRGVPVDLLCLLFLSVIAVFFTACVSTQMAEKIYIRGDLKLTSGEVFFVESFTVTSYDFIEEDQVRTIMDRKLTVALMSEPSLSFSDRGEESDYLLYPELIIKRYQQRYTERYYYLMSVKILREQELLGQYTYEYNGASSIFDGKVQSALIEKFVNDIVKRMKP